MKKFLFLTVFLTISFASVFSQLNLDSISHLDLPAMHNTELNDIWGYSDPNGREYALVGMQNGTSIVDVTNQTNPVEVFYGPGLQSVWRDIKTWNNYAYVTTEAQQGLYIIDLSNLPASNLNTTLYTGPAGNEWFSAHNIYIDSAGYAYIFGANRGNGGIIILDLNTDPMNPTEVGVFDPFYCHDGYALGNRLYGAHINDGFFTVLDITDRANPIFLGLKNTPNDFAHNIWARADNQVVFTTDEVSGAFLTAYDVSNPANIVELDRIQSSPGAGVIPHNTHVLGNFLITSYYADGVTIHDATYPYNMVQTGNYDTYPTQTTSYDGNWGVFPYLPSGLVVASDITEGLFVLNPNYVQGSYLEGTVTDASNGNPLNDVLIDISSFNIQENSDFTGFYATGIAANQSVDVTYNKVGYVPQTITINFQSGVITIQDVALIPLNPFNLTVHVEDNLGNPINNAQIKLVHPLITHSGQTNAIGDENFTLFYQEGYRIFAGKWGYITECFDQVIDENTIILTVVLEEGIYDDFEFDFGWTITSTAATGIWERAIPTQISANSSPKEDAQFDCGKMTFITGNNPSFNSNLDDVDEGFTRITSPVFDLSSYSTPYINFSYWFYNFNGPITPFDDTLKIRISDGLVSQEILKVGSIGDTAFWTNVSLKVSDFITPSSNMTLSVLVSDEEPAMNITEAAFDRFFISETNTLNTEETVEQNKKITLYPNPVSTNILHIKGVEFAAYFEIFDFQGKQVMNGNISENKSIFLESLDPGIYILRIEGGNFRFIKQ